MRVVRAMSRGCVNGCGWEAGWRTPTMSADQQFYLSKLYHSLTQRAAAKMPNGIWSQGEHPPKRLHGETRYMQGDAGKGCVWDV